MLRAPWPTLIIGAAIVLGNTLALYSQGHNPMLSLVGVPFLAFAAFAWRA